MDEPSTDDPRPERGPGEVFCRDCGAVISEKAEICPECGVRQRDPPKSSLESSLESALEDLTEGGNPFLAALLSALLPGLGQIYNRELKKGLYVIVGSILAVFSALALVGFVLYPAIWIYAIWDAYRVAERREQAAASGVESATSGGEGDATRAGDEDADAGEGSSGDSDRGERGEW